MQFTANQIATLLGGTVEGSPEVVVSQLAKIEEGTEGCLSFLANPKYEHFLYDTGASIVIVNEDLQLAKPVRATLIRVKDAYSAFSELLKIYHQLRNEKIGREEPSFVHESAQLGEGIYLGAFSYIGKDVKIGNNVKIYPQVFVGDNVTIGDDCVLFPGVKVYYDTKIGDRVVIHGGVVLGSDGFGFAPQKDGSYNKVPQIGNVILESDVEIGANTVIDRATMGSTVIRQGVKLDNLIQIAHNVEIGKNTVAAAQTGISGSTKVGENVILGGQVGLVGHIQIASGSQIQAQSGVNRSIVEENKKWGGTPSLPYSSNLRSHVFYAKLPSIEKRISELEFVIRDLKNETP
ncbi:UDP-3-O-(3-hydroxymyristoyl)glucosamine N-acyltransferase [Sphingobacterium psychroaquaticum]|uniref:UDP-3-O-acylglucosamine N-acyltransferase n=1 Tax=Sphingobacterium psychroaquaticum TaxID=561061 RepID=A0A1X7K2P2_9SPHI|nr:UDP-3-O-(3-hydroxymyristoyl)glucosamine N-acyltransferase [Sphingobacterium psychroaquaticum]QBQ42592.1 UDP-3-O-(3-hydroxymyristoyl)glucosamine N-acyltransferase [Sphingobacterium psychroaquaticum]SMG35167.1 UDP-3-O-[3-hydroxymyristoyl] glucosamine N-acyltransferase [Sphingobacterium psychroaquaticum]